jgi:hypothetical protein
MPNFGSPFPFPVPPRDDKEEAPITVEAQAAPGEVALDAVVRAQSSAPQIRKRIGELEKCIWSLADFLERVKIGRGEDWTTEAEALIQRAKQVLEGHLEIDDAPE